MAKAGSPDRLLGGEAGYRRVPRDARQR